MRPKTSKAAARKVTPAMADMITKHLGGKPMNKKMHFPLKPNKAKLDAEDLIDGGADEATEKK